MNTISCRLLAFTAGILLAIFLPALPNPLYLPAAVLAAAWMLCRPGLILPACVLLGLLWHIYWADDHLAREIPAAWEGQSLQLEGVVIGLPQALEQPDGSVRSRFEFAVDSVLERGRELRFNRPLVLRLNWYQAQAQAQALAADQRWRLAVELRQPRGLANPGGFDYRLWLLAKGVGGVGKVIAHDDNEQLGVAGNSLTNLRQWYRRQLQRHLQGQTVAPLIAALAMGDRQQLTPEQKNVLTVTGTGHLMVISGLHVGLVALLGYGLCYLVLGCSPALVQSGFALVAARTGALMGATLYAALSGFALPTQRALIMLSIFLLARQAGRETASLQVWLLALCAVLLLDPLAVISAGFWLSFAAVCVLMAPGPRRPGATRSWRAPVLLQLRLTVGLCPVLALWGGQLSLVGPLVNLLAIPFVGFCIVPLLLAVFILLPLNDAIAACLLDWVVWLMGAYWRALESVAAFVEPWPAPPFYPGGVALCMALVAVVLFLMPRGLPGRGVWPVLLLPLFMPVQQLRSDFDLYVLDVGQGSAVVVRTAEHLLIYDAGPAYRGGFDAGAAIVLPFLRKQGLRQVDRLVISHADTDHSGGAGALLRELRVKQWMAPQAIPALGEPDLPCRAGQHWQWDGIHFSVLHPGGALPASSNNQSCVLLIDTGSTRYLLAGDIEREVERELAARLGPALKVDVLLVPHHGSRSSSSYDFSWFARPDVAVVSAAYGNRFGHPAQPVVRRYQELNSVLVNTAETGALHFRRDASFTPYRWFSARYWQYYPCGLSAPAREPWLARGWVRAAACSRCCPEASSGAVARAFLW